MCQWPEPKELKVPYRFKSKIVLRVSQRFFSTFSKKIENWVLLDSQKRKSRSHRPKAEPRDQWHKGCGKLVATLPQMWLWYVAALNDEKCDKLMAVADLCCVKVVASIYIYMEALQYYWTYICITACYLELWIVLSFQSRENDWFQQKFW